MLRRDSWALAMVAVGLALASAGCASDDSGGGLPTDGVFASTPRSTFPLVAGTSVRMELIEGRLSVSAGCNSLMGAYRVDGGILIVPVLGSTRIGCPPALSEQDRRLEQFLTSSPAIASDSVGFTITATDGASLQMARIGPSTPAS